MGVTPSTSNDDAEILIAVLSAVSLRTGGPSDSDRSHKSRPPNPGLPGLPPARIQLARGASPDPEGP